MKNCVAFPYNMGRSFYGSPHWRRRDEYFRNRDDELRYVFTAADKKALVAFLKTLTDDAFIDRTNLARVQPISAEPILARRR